MKKFYIAKAQVTSGSGAGYCGTPAHQYCSGNAESMCRSPKQAVQIAKSLAYGRLEKEEKNGWYMQVLSIVSLDGKELED